MNEVVSAFHNGQKVAFHCGGGKGRTGTVAIGTLLAPGEAQTIAEAVEMAKSIRIIIQIKPTQRESLEKIFEASLVL
ncbi:protein-tyrosine phosphatase family protein [Paenibacillus sp. AK002]